MQNILIHVVYFAVINLALVLLGYVFVKRELVWPGWLSMLLVIPVVYCIFNHEHPVLKMLGIIATTFTGMKVITATVDYSSKKTKLKFIPWLAFAVGWAGMRAQPFETLGQQALPNAWTMIRFGISRVIGGLLLIVLAHGIVVLHFDTGVTYFLVSPLLLVALSLILHFGLLSIGAGQWRLMGVNTYYLFRQPAKSMSLTEFWGKRWNLAFIEMTTITIFRLLRNKIGRGGALAVAFLFSGLLHELALSVPVNSGYGLPMLYFVIQGVVLLVEKKLIRRNIAFLKHPILARLWLFFWLVVPMPLLFHAQFIKLVVWPLGGFI
ncbi:alginate O-acetyltransferase complex protein AlgI [Mucilaginibacter gossypiicola]|uniref:Alginate O-acetyltransferase complex protein AlgI n=1 Tax=Mucilaginibacter gossypiicola TaxID=551995 RepID=A0A1H8T503_9SPHI|nr:membrane bound O-acyl transferase family-domain-containing protein [Mucilaginibacter gossypiicola]SEO85766.1 alginate O-acetyltransferase complex protein AlgI [Mucilaginibacter gossypiicola]